MKPKKTTGKAKDGKSGGKAQEGEKPPEKEAKTYKTLCQEGQATQAKVMKQAIELALKQVSIDPVVYKKTFAVLAADPEFTKELK